ncbi:MAG TPA: tetratricopeptide repeat protein [Kofleriaceae bacterium]|jgi:tetratricopeptide (TPR) repeat protein|nr:tetratricopeptide repeat protein [Kofleriaceae bacterium]
MSGTSAATRPEPDAGQDLAEAEGWALLDGLRRRLDEQGAQTRKTAAQVQQLADSIGALVAAQRRRSRSLNLNSYVAYVIFTVLLGGAFYFLYESRARDLVAARDRAATERDTAARGLSDATGKLAARDAADAKAVDAWQLLEAGKRDAAAKRLAELANAPLPKLERDMLAARAKQAELVQVDAALKSAGIAYRTGKFAEAATTLEAALTLQGAAPRLGDVHLQLALSQLKLGVLDKAVVHLQAAVDAGVADEDARFQLAGALDRLGQWGKARVEYDKFATAHPQSAWAVPALRRSAQLAHMPALAPWITQPGQPKPAPAPVPAPAAAPPATGSDGSAAP